MSELSGLLVDWGGVLTPSLDGAMSQWAVAEGIDVQHFREVIRQWVAQHPDGSPAHQLERGEISPAEFERRLATELAARGCVVEHEGLLTRMLGGLIPLSGDMMGLVRRIRAAGFRTALLSNSWGDHYPEELWDDLFDAVVISGRVGMRKPERRIFEHTAELIGLAPQQCVMVDDLPHNVHAAVAAGLVGVLHRSFDETAVELEALFGVALLPS